MFEFTDKTKKKIKVINVTEARGNFAAILADTDAQYIITKNNKPQSVILGFEEFKKLQGDLGGQTLPDQAVQMLSTTEEAPPEGAAPRKAKPSPSVRGMIAAQVELSQQNEKPQPEVPEDFSLESVAAAPKNTTEDEKTTAEESGAAVLFAGEAELPAPQESEEAASVAGDYFDSDAEEAVLVEPELAEEKAELNAPPIEAEDVAESVARANRDALIQDADFYSTRPAPLEAESEPQRTPEEEAYFRRYRKLYEGYPPVFSDEERKEPAFVIPEIKPTRAVREESPDMAAPLGASPWWVREEASSSTASSGGAPERAGHLTTDDSDEKARLSSDRPAREEALPQVKADESLPSLQELLRDLDKQRLTGEEPHSLDARDIDDIINRITSD